MGALFTNAVLDQLGKSVWAMEEHLTHNCYPPVPNSMAPACMLAVEAVETGDYDAEITLPKGCLYKGKKVVCAQELVECFHLEPFIELCIDDEDDLNVPYYQEEI